MRRLSRSAVRAEGEFQAEIPRVTARRSACSSPSVWGSFTSTTQFDGRGGRAVLFANPSAGQRV